MNLTEKRFVREIKRLELEKDMVRKDFFKHLLSVFPYEELKFDSLEYHKGKVFLRHIFVGSARLPVFIPVEDLLNNVDKITSSDDILTYSKDLKCLTCEEKEQNEEQLKEFAKRCYDICKDKRDFSKKKIMKKVNDLFYVLNNMPFLGMSNNCIVSCIDDLTAEVLVKLLAKYHDETKGIVNIGGNRMPDIDNSIKELLKGEENYNAS